MPIITSTPFGAVVPEFAGNFVPNGGTVQKLNIPAGVNSVLFKMWGGGGAGGTWDHHSRGGGGGYSTGVLAISGPVTLDIYVGEGGKKHGYTADPRAGGWPGGGDGGPGSSARGGGGGGFSAVFPEGDFTTPYIIAGGGGGAGTTYAKGGGGLVNWYTEVSNSGYGFPGSQTSGGARGTKVGNFTPGNAGSFLAGGSSTSSWVWGGGGGGGGYYGGGSGATGGTGNSFGPPGGGGSSYIGHPDLSSEQSIGSSLQGSYGFGTWWQAGNHNGADIPFANAGRGGWQNQNGTGGGIYVYWG